MKRLVLCLLLLMTIAAPAAAVDWWEDEPKPELPVSFEIGTWFSNIRGSISWGSKGIPGSDINLRDDLGFTSTEVSPQFNLNIGLSDNWQFRFGYWRSDQSNLSELPRNISFAGKDFTAGLDTRSVFTLDSYAANFAYRFVEGPQIDLTAIAGINLFRARLEMEQADGTYAREIATVPAPQIGLGIDIKLADFLTLQGNAFAMSLTHRRSEGLQLNAEAALKWRLLEDLYITTGYRYMEINTTFKNSVDRNADFTLEGPFIAVGFGF